MAKANAQIEITASSSRLVAGLSAAHAKFTSFAGSVARGMGRAFKGINAKLAPGDTAKRAIGNFGGDMMGRGLDAVLDAANGVRDFERNLMRFQIATDGTKASTAAMRNEVRAVSKDTGIAAADVLAGAQAYVGFTGDAAGAKDAMKMFSDVAVATGASVADVAQGMASLKTSMGITAKEGEAAFSALIVQGKGGAVEIKDMASELASLAPQFALFKGGKGLDGLREMGAGFQVIMKNSSSASDAATKYASLMGALSDSKTRKELQAIGVQVTDNKGKLLGASTIFENIAKSQKLFAGSKMSEVFGRKEAQLAVLALREHIGTYRDLRNAAEDTGAVQRDKMTMLESESGKLDRAFNQMKLTIAEAFTPARIKMFTEGIQALAQQLGPVVDGFSKIAGFTFGNLFSLGKSVRGVFSGNNNPYGTEGELAKQRQAQLAAFHQTQDPLQKMKDDSAILNSRSYNRTVDHIMGGEKDEKSTPESLRRAYFAAKEDPTKLGNLGGIRAADRYLEASGMTKQEAGESIMKEMIKTLEKNNADLVYAIKSGTPAPVVQIGDNQVARSVDKSTTAARNPQ